MHRNQESLCKSCAFMYNLSTPSTQLMPPELWKFSFNKWIIYFCIASFCERYKRYDA